SVDHAPVHRVWANAALQTKSIAASIKAFFAMFLSLRCTTGNHSAILLPPRSPAILHFTADSVSGKIAELKPREVIMQDFPVLEHFVRRKPIVPTVIRESICWISLDGDTVEASVDVLNLEGNPSEELNLIVEAAPFGAFVPG